MRLRSETVPNLNVKYQNGSTFVSEVVADDILSDKLGMTVIGLM